MIDSQARNSGAQLERLSGHRGYSSQRKGYHVCSWSVKHELG